MIAHAQMRRVLCNRTPRVCAVKTMLAAPTLLSQVPFPLSVNALSLRYPPPPNRPTLQCRWSTHAPLATSHASSARFALASSRRRSSSCSMQSLASDSAVSRRAPHPMDSSIAQTFASRRSCRLHSRTLVCFVFVHSGACFVFSLSLRPCRCCLLFTTLLIYCSHSPVSMQRAMRLGLELPEAPVFHPTMAEFADPIAYIRSIRSVAEQFGICRIIPPAEWKPPFAIDPATFRFNTRAQRIDRLQEATGAPSGLMQRIDFLTAKTTPLY